MHSTFTAASLYFNTHCCPQACQRRWCVETVFRVNLKGLETAANEPLSGHYVPMAQPNTLLEAPKAKVTKEEMDMAVLVSFQMHS